MCQPGDGFEETNNNHAVYFSVDDECSTLADTNTVHFQCADYKNGSYKSCIPQCKSDAHEEYVFLEPVPKRINCGPSGVYDPNKPKQSFQISECGSKLKVFLTM